MAGRDKEPARSPRWGFLKRRSPREEIEQFFLSATFFTGKDPKIEGWRGPKAALGVVKQTMQCKRRGT